jgi:hypothetical protein
MGFRQIFPLFILPYFLTLSAIDSQNFGVGGFSLILLPLICTSFYSTPEPPFYVWIYTLNARQFLFYKIKTALLFSSILSVPALLCLITGFSSEIGILLAVQVLGYLYLIAFVLGKYALFPAPIDIISGFLLVASILFPPLLLITIPLFYRMSIQKLQTILP